MIYHNFSMQFKNNSAGRRSSRVRTAKKKQLSGKEEERDRSRYGKVHDAGDVCVCVCTFTLLLSWAFVVPSRIVVPFQFLPWFQFESADFWICKADSDSISRFL